MQKSKKLERWRIFVTWMSCYYWCTDSKRAFTNSTHSAGWPFDLATYLQWIPPSDGSDHSVLLHVRHHSRVLHVLSTEEEASSWLQPRGARFHVRPYPVPTWLRSLGRIRKDRLLRSSAHATHWRLNSERKSYGVLVYILIDFGVWRTGSARNVVWHFKSELIVNQEKLFCSPIHGKTN